MENKERKAPFIAVSRHRLQTDGRGVTTLAGFYGCPLRCRYCLNPHSFADGTRVRMLTPKELYEAVKVDELYFLATDGGVTFGGGEPLLHADFIREFRELCGRAWHICAETSLSVPAENVRLAAECVDEFFVDCKDSNPDIYRRYTGKDNAIMLENLRYLVSAVGDGRITVRVPLIPEFNNDSDREKSVELFRSMGLTRFDLFEYRTKK
jgi:pyruvate formate lyase activating enzyme